MTSENDIMWPTERSKVSVASGMRKAMARMPTTAFSVSTSLMLPFQSRNVLVWVIPKKIMKAAHRYSALNRSKPEPMDP